MSDMFNRSIGQCIELLVDIDFLFQAGPYYSLNSSDAFKKAAMRSTTYREVYDVGASNQDFNLMMNDQSYFQFTEIKAQEELRFAYYPNPYQFVEYINDKRAALTMLESGEINREEYDQLLSEGTFTCDIPLIRYDLSLKQYSKKYHPAAHFHIGFYAENRWPVRRKLTPFAFLLDVLTLYYPKLWRSAGDADVIYRKEVSQCNYLEEQYFSEEEFQRLYFN